MLATVVLTAFGSVGFSSVFKDIPIYVAFYTNALPCLTVYIVTLIPDACHDNSKIFVKGFCIFTGVVLGLIVHIIENYNNTNIYGIGFSIIVGTGFSGLSWFTTYLLCTHEFRQALIKSSPCVGRICPWLQDDIDSLEKYDKVDIQDELEKQNN